MTLPAVKFIETTEEGFVTTSGCVDTEAFLNMASHPRRYVVPLDLQVGLGYTFNPATFVATPPKRLDQQFNSNSVPVGSFITLPDVPNNTMVVVTGPIVNKFVHDGGDLVITFDHPGAYNITVAPEGWLLTQYQITVT